MRADPSHMPAAGSDRLRRSVTALVLLVAALAHVGAPGAEPADPRHLVTAGALIAQPAALQTGTTAGIDVSYRRRWRWPWLAWGVRASWSTATEYTLDWAVRDDEVRLRGFGAVQRRIGRGAVGLRLGLGGTLVHEGRTSSRVGRAGSGADLETSAWSFLPAAELEGTVQLRVLGSWGLVVSGGPSLHLEAGAARFGWLVGLGGTWQR